jgi:SprT protein
MSKENELKIIEKCKDYIDLISGLYKIKLEYPEIFFNIKGRAAGKAYLEKWIIKFNNNYIDNNLDNFLNDTVPHEIAHLIAWKLYKNTGHKTTWKKIMKDLNCKNINRCHNYN